MNRAVTCVETPLIYWEKKMLAVFPILANKQSLRDELALLDKLDK